MGSMYAAVLFIGTQNSSSVQPVVAVERTVFYREKAAGMYSALSYAFAQVLKGFFFSLSPAWIKWCWKQTKNTESIGEIEGKNL